MRQLLAVCFAFLASAGAVSAQNCTAAGMPSSCAVARSLQITVRRTISVAVSPASVALPGPSAYDFEAGYSAGAGHAVLIRSNNDWTLSIRSTQTNWTGSGGARTNKPRGDLTWSTDPAGPYMPINGTVTQATGGGATAGTTVQLYYRILWSWALDRPGTYALPVQLTISAP